MPSSELGKTLTSSWYGSLIPLSDANIKVGIDVTGTNKSNINASLTEESSISYSSFDDHQHGYCFNFERAGLIGRDTEKRVLSNAIDQLLKRQSADAQGDGDGRRSSTRRPSQRQHQSQASSTALGSLKTLCLLSGLSGTGKSALAMHYRQHCLDKFGFSVSGKFDLQQMEEPYAGIKSAMGQLMGQIRALPSDEDTDATTDDPRSLSAFQQAMILGLSPSELRTLHKIIPGLSQVITGNYATHNGKAQDGGSVSDGDSAHFPADEDSMGESASVQYWNARGLVRQSSCTSMASSASGSDGRTLAMGAAGAVTEGYQNISDRIKHASKRFLQIVCKHAPLVLVMDDIQWADKASLDLIQAWTLDSEVSSLMIMGCYRSDHLEHNTMLQNMITTLEESKRERAIRIINISMNDLPLGSIREILIEIILPDNDVDVNGLADIVYRKTGGNVFFMKQFLESLVDQRLLSFDVDGGMKWVWDEGKIIAESSATANIIDLMNQKLHRVDAARHVLPVAACLGSTFSKRKLIVVMRALSIHSDHSAFFRDLLMSSDDSLSSDSSQDPSLAPKRQQPQQGRRQSDPASSSNIRKSLDVCEREGLIEQHNYEYSDQDSRRRQPRGRRKQKEQQQQQQQSFRSMQTKTQLKLAASGNRGDACTFIHDKIQEAALALLPEEKLSELRFRVGDVLLASSTADYMREDEVYATVGLINSRLDLVPTSTQQSARRTRIAMLNAKAGQLAVECAAFSPALGYFKTAIKLLPPDHWKSHFHESLNIYSSAAECAHIIKDSDERNRYCSAILSLDCPILDKVRAYHISTDGLLAEKRAESTAQVIPMILQLLDQLGCKLPKGTFRRSIRFLRGLFKLKRAASKWTLQTFQDKSTPPDATQVAITETLEKLALVAFLIRPELFPFFALETTERTLKYGIMPNSSTALAALAAIVGYFMGDFEASRNISEIALQMTDLPSNQHSKCSAMFTINATCQHWMKPLGSTVDDYWRAYEHGMACGDVDFGLRSAAGHLQGCFYAGRPLDQLDEEMAKMSNIMKDFQELEQRDFLSANWQAVRNLRGLSSNETKVVGELFDEDAFSKRPSEDVDEFSALMFLVYRQILAVFFGDYELGAKTSLDVFDEQVDKFAGLSYLPIGARYGGICCYVMCQRSGKTAKAKQYRRHADRCRQMLRKWKKWGNPNCDHGLAFLDAERKMVQSKYDAAVVRFNDAINLSKAIGFTHDQALANERLSECFMKMGMKGAALLALDESVRLYEVWGATRKVQKLSLSCEKMRVATPS